MSSRMRIAFLNLSLSRFGAFCVSALPFSIQTVEKTIIFATREISPLFSTQAFFLHCQAFFCI